MKKNFLLGAGGVAVLVAAVLFFNSMGSDVNTPVSQAENQNMPAVDVTAAPSPSPEPEMIVQPAPSPAPAPQPAPAPAAAPTVKELVVTGSNYSFAPGTLTVKKGDTVKITFKNADGFHDFKIDEFSVGTQKLKGGTEEVVQFVADKAGSFEYYCSVGSHRAMGMKGMLTVTE